MSSLLESLNLVSCDLNDESISGIAYLFSCCFKLRHVNLSNNEVVAIFKNLCKSSATLESLNLYFCELDEQNVKGISNLFLQCTNLNSIDLSWNKNICPKNYQIFRNLGKSSSFLEKLDLSSCDIDEDSIKQISYLISNCFNLRSVNLNSNDGIGLTTHSIFTNQCKSSDTLESLHLSSCKLDEDNIESISNLVSCCFNLKNIDLSWNNQIGRKKHNIFKNLSKSSDSLETISLFSCELSEENIENVSYLFSLCSILKNVYLNMNFEIEYASPSIVTNLFKSAHSLETLDLSKCYLDKEIIHQLDVLRDFSVNIFYDSRTMKPMDSPRTRLKFLQGGFKTMEEFYLKD